MRNSFVHLTALGAVATLAASASAATFYQRAVVDLSPITSTAGGPSDIGTNASAVAFDGTNAYLAGFNGGSDARDTAIVTANNVLGTPTFSARYGVQTATPAGGRGYLGADFKSGVGVATVFDNGTTGSVALYNGSSQTFTFNTAARPPAGPSFDTQSSRLTYIYQGSGLARNVDVTNGASTGNPNTNINNLGLGTAYRDFDYASNGDLYARLNNDVVRGNRADASSYTTTPTLLVNLTDANNIGENIAVIEGFGTAPTFAIYNNKASNSTGQAFASVVAAVRADGTSEALSFLTGDGSGSVSFADGTGFYDFSYDAATQQLALLDYTNRQLYIFGATANVIPEPTTLAAVAGLGGLLLRRRRA